MSSLFATGIKRRNSPAWCKKGMYPKILPQIDGRPTALNGYANWSELSSGREVILIQAFTLHRVPGFPEWFGASFNTGPNLALSVEGAPGSTSYAITLYLRQDQAVLDTAVWPAVEIPLPEPWDTSWLNHVITPHIDYRRIRILS